MIRQCQVSGPKLDVEEAGDEYREIGGAEKKISRGDIFRANEQDHGYVTATMCKMGD